MPDIFTTFLCILSSTLFTAFLRNAKHGKHELLHIVTNCMGYVKYILGYCLLVIIPNVWICMGPPHLRMCLNVLRSWLPTGHYYNSIQPPGPYSDLTVVWKTDQTFLKQVDHWWTCQCLLQCSCGLWPKIQKCNLTLQLVICTCDMHFLGQDPVKKPYGDMFSCGYLQYFSKYEYYSSLNFFYRQTDRQTESDANEPTVQHAQVGSKTLYVANICF